MMGAHRSPPPELDAPETPRVRAGAFRIARHLRVDTPVCTVTSVSKRFATYRIDEDLMDAVTARAATCGETVTDVVVRAFRDYVGVSLPPADNPPAIHAASMVMYTTDGDDGAGGRVIRAYRPYHARGCPARSGEADVTMCLCGGLTDPLFNH